MIFSNDTPIYKQITDYCCSRIAVGEWKSHDRIPSVKDLSIKLQVNARTILKAYEEMENAGFIYQKRGLGFFVAEDAIECIREREIDAFMNNILPSVAKKMNTLDIPLSEVVEKLKESGISVDDISQI